MVLALVRPETASVPFVAPASPAVAIARLCQLAVPFLNLVVVVPLPAAILIYGVGPRINGRAFVGV